MKELAPVGIFAFNRPDHLARLLRSVDANPESERTVFYLFCDGPRSRDDEANVAAVHAMADQFATTHDAKVLKRSENLGLASSILAGVAVMLETHDRFVVLEDDLILDPNFLQFMNEALDAFESRPDIGCVTGYMYPVSLAEPQWSLAVYHQLGLGHLGRSVASL